MSASDIIEVLADEEGNVDINEAIAMLQESIASNSYELSAVDVLNLVQMRLDVVETTFVNLIVATQAALIDAHRGIDTIIKGEPSDIGQMDAEQEREALFKHLVLENSANIYDYVQEKSSEAAAGDGSGADNPVAQGGPVEAGSEATPEG